MCALVAHACQGSVFHPDAPLYCGVVKYYREPTCSGDPYTIASSVSSFPSVCDSFNITSCRPNGSQTGDYILTYCTREFPQIPGYGFVGSFDMWPNITSGNQFYPNAIVTGGFYGFSMSNCSIGYVAQCNSTDFFIKYVNHTTCSPMIPNGRASPIDWVTSLNVTVTRTTYSYAYCVPLSTVSTTTSPTTRPSFGQRIDAGWQFLWLLVTLILLI